MPFTTLPAEIAIVKNPIDFVHEAPDLGAGIYTASVRVIVNGVSIYADYTYDAARRIYVNIQEILRPYTGEKAQLVKQGNGIWRMNTSRLVRYEVYVYYYKDGDYQNFNAYGVAGTFYYAILAGKDYVRFKTETWLAGIVGTFYNTILPLTRKVDRKELVTVPIYYDAPNGTLTLILELYDAEDNLLASPNYSCLNNARLNCPVFSFDSLTVDGAWYGVSKDDVAYFIPRLRKDGVLLEQTGNMKFVLTPKQYEFPLRSFLYATSRGGYEVLNLTGQKEPITESSSQRANVYYRGSYAIGDTQMTEYNRKQKETIRIHTGYFPTNREYKIFQEFIHSDDVYEYIDGQILPISINKDKYPLGADNTNARGNQFEYIYRFENFAPTTLVDVD